MVFPIGRELCDTWERRRPGGIQAGETPALPGSSSLGSQEFKRKKILD
jgi:hypothetical protein